MQYTSTANMLCSPDAAMLQHWTDIAASFDQYSFSEAGHVQLNVLEDRGTCDAEYRAVCPVVKLGLSKTTRAGDQNALCDVHSLPAAAGPACAYCSAHAGSETQSPSCSLTDAVLSGMAGCIQASCVACATM